MQHEKTVLFLCPHGGAKSLIAASYFNRLAKEHDLPYVAIAAAAEDPYDAVPQPVAELLDRDGFDVRDFVPQHVTANEVQSAAQIISIDCDLTALGDAANVEPWTDVPKVSDDLHGSAAALRRHVSTLAEELRVRR